MREKRSFFRCKPCTMLNNRACRLKRRGWVTFSIQTTEDVKHEMNFPEHYLSKRLSPDRKKVKVKKPLKPIDQDDLIAVEVGPKSEAKVDIPGKSLGVPALLPTLLHAWSHFKANAQMFHPVKAVHSDSLIGCSPF